MTRILLWLCAVCVFTVSGSLSQSPGQRQYYTEWKKHTAKNYYYREYKFKKAANDENYTYHYGIYFPSRGHRVYMYNPQSRMYWGYWEGDKYSLLPEGKRKSSIEEIPLEDFPRPGPPPEIPGIADKTTMIAPPNDFPKLDNE
jgi:hypothetical protein